uniref:Uncharacterized protein n=1 Tax=Ditylum brightwellii TaxID=49249 RepID=A0A7S2EJW6_9STRA
MKEPVQAYSYQKKEAGSVTGHNNSAIQMSQPSTADSEDSTTLQRLHLKQEKILNNYTDSLSRKNTHQPSSLHLKRSNDTSVSSNTNGKRKVIPAATKKRNVKPKVGNKKEKDSVISDKKYSQQATTNETTKAYSVGTRDGDIQRKGCGVISAPQKHFPKQIQQKTPRQVKKVQAKEQQQKKKLSPKHQPASLAQSPGGLVKQKAPVNFSRRVSDFKEDCHQPATKGKIPSSDPALNPPKLRYFNNGVEVDVNGVPVVIPCPDDEHSQPSKPRSIELSAAVASHTVHQTGLSTSSDSHRVPPAKKTSSSNATLGRSRASSPKTKTIKGRSSAATNTTAPKPSVKASDALPALPKSFLLGDLLSFVRVHIPELTSALATIEKKHTSTANLSAHHHASAAAHSTAVDAILNELYYIFEGGLVEGLPTEREVGSAKDDDQLRARTATCIGAIEICKRRHSVREISTIGINKAPATSTTSSSRKQETTESVEPKSREDNSPQTRHNGSTSSSYFAANVPAKRPLQPLFPNTTYSALAKIAPKPPILPSAAGESQMSLQHPLKDSDAHSSQAQQCHVRSEHPATNKSAMPRRISMISEPGGPMKYSLQKKQRRRSSVQSSLPSSVQSSVQSSGLNESCAGPHSDLMGEIFGEEKLPPKEIDTKPSDFTADPSKIAQASVDELVKDSLKEREKTLSAASVLLDLIGGNKS